MGEAGAALDLGPAGISGLVDRMVASGLVERRADDDDARASRVFLTPKGRKSLVRARETARAMNARLADGFSDQEIDIVARDGATLVFAEVRSRHADDVAPAFESIGPRKRQRMVAAAYEYLAAHNLDDADWRIDIVAVAIRRGRQPIVDHVENALGW